MVEKTNKHTITDHGRRNPRSGREGKDKAFQVVSKRYPCQTNREDKTKLENIRIGTWNVRSMFQPGKMHNVLQEMQRLKVNILGVSEARWPDSGYVSAEKATIYYSGSNDNQHKNGVAVIVSEEVQRTVENFVPISDRVMILQIKTNHTKMNLIQVYAPTADGEDNDIETFYEQIEEALKMTKCKEITMILGDLNAKIGKGQSGKNVGKYGLGERNERGDRLMQFCQDQNLIITNTFFKLPDRRLYTWRSPADKPNKIVRNQIDYIMINERYRNAVKAVKAYPGADVFSDHNPIIAKVTLKLKNIKRHQRTPRMETRKLKDPVVKQTLQQKVHKNLDKLNIKNEDVDEQWKALKQCILDPSKEILKEPPKKKEKWMNDQILSMMEQRRQFKNTDEHTYRKLNYEIRKKIREAKETYFEEKCKEIEDLQNRYDLFNLHKKVKEMTGIQHHNPTNALLDRNGNTITQTDGKLQRWKEYIEELFDDEKEKKQHTDCIPNETGPDITKEEIVYALKTAKEGKSPGPDELPIELLKIIETEYIDILVKLFNQIYKSGVIPKEWLVSTFICLPKKVNARECSDHRTISLMSHTLKLLLKIIHNRIYQKLDMDIGETQFGFRKGLGTREALFALNVLIQRCLDVNQDMYICFIDYNKAFDRVRHKQLMEVLKAKQIDYNDLRIISNLYYEQRAKVRINGHMSEEIEIKRGVRQGCILSPLLFNAYSEEILKKALEEETAGIKINGIPVNNIRYADDTIIIAENIDDLQRLMNRIAECGQEYGLTMNAKKTKFMRISKTQRYNEQLTINGTKIEQVDKYKYLGTLIDSTNDYSREIRARIEIARANFNKLKRVLCTKDLKLNLRVRLLKCYVFSTLLYGMEAWTLNAATIRKLESFERWTYRRILKILWTEHVTNNEVMRRINKEMEIIETIKTRKLQYLGHITRGTKYARLQLIMQGKILGKRSIGRRKKSWLRNLREWYGCTSIDLFRAAASKVRIAVMITNLRRGDGT